MKDQWKANADIQAKMHTLGLADEDALQSWFIARIGKFLKAHGRRLIGWDEILQGGVPPDATITSWRGIDGALAAAKGGHDAVLSPAPVLYLDNRQVEGPNEPSGRGAIVSLGDVYDFDPGAGRVERCRTRPYRRRAGQYLDRAYPGGAQRRLRGLPRAPRRWPSLAGRPPPRMTGRVSLRACPRSWTATPRSACRMVRWRRTPRLRRRRSATATN